MVASSLFFSFQGRINRARWWLGSAMLRVLSAVVAGVNWAAVQDGGITTAGPALLAVITYVIGARLLWPILVVAVKRWHDRGKSGWWVLINLIPVIGVIWSFIELGLLKGDGGPNQYGADPLGVTAGPSPS